MKLTLPTIVLLLWGLAAPAVAAQAEPQQPPPPPAPGPQAEIIEMCMACHGDAGMAVTLESGEVRSLHVDPQVFAGSVHGSHLSCLDCHPDMIEIPHPSKPFKTLREFTIAYYESCKKCHFANYSKTLDSVHYQALARGDTTAPTCVDCHGAHDVTRPGQPRSRISQTCAKCHEGVQQTYAKSVHGRALHEESNQDVPVCTDCHRTHDVAGPHSAMWRLNSPEMCATCHANEAMMEKYGISTSVLDTYLSDFHGVTATLQRTGKPADPGRVAAVCTDCHGVHDITAIEDKASPAMQENLLKVCQRCHEGAGPNFPAAWMSHYEPSWETAPLVHSVQLFYNVFIPFIIGGLVLQILLHLWRVVVNR